MADTFYTIELIDKVSAGARKADRNLKRLDKTVARTKRHAEESSRAYKRFGDATRTLASEQTRAERAVRRTARAIDDLNSKNVKDIGRAGGSGGRRRGGGRFDRGGDFRDRLLFANTLSRASAGLDRFRRGVTNLFTNPINESARFARGVAEITTLTDEATFSTEEIRTATQSMARVYGGDILRQTTALYGLMSAGASQAADATERLNVANKLAVGGVTDVQTAAAPLIAAMNAYGLSGAEASKVSDVLFSTVKAGVTTIPELSASLGQVTAPAAALGVTIEELGGFVAALTKVTNNTPRAVTQLNAILSTFLKPPAESLKLAEELGFDLSATALRTKTLAEALKDFDEKAREHKGVDGFIKLVGKMFKNQRASKGVMAASANEFRNLDEAIRTVATGAKASDKAFEKIVNQDFFKLELAKSAFQELKVAVGDAALPALTALTNELRTGGTATFKEFGDTIANVVRMLGPAGLATVIGAGILSPLILAGSAAITMFSAVTVAIGAVGGAAAAAGIAVKALALGAGVFGGRALAEGYIETDFGKADQRRTTDLLLSLPDPVKNLIGLKTDKLDLTDAAKRFMRNPEHGALEFFGEEGDTPEMDFFSKIDRLQGPSATSIGSAAGRALSETSSPSTNRIGAINVNVNVDGSQSPVDTAAAVAGKLDEEIADLFQRHLEGAGA